MPYFKQDHVVSNQSWSLLTNFEPVLSLALVAGCMLCREVTILCILEKLYLIICYYVVHLVENFAFIIVTWL